MAQYFPQVVWNVWANQSSRFFSKEKLMRRILTLLVVLAFWSVPVAEAKLHIFQPPSLKKMTKAPLLQKEKPAGEAYNGKAKSGLLGRCR